MHRRHPCLTTAPHLPARCLRGLRPPRRGGTSPVPVQADFFFIPLHLSLGYYSHRYYFKHFTQPAHKPLRDAVQYVQKTWPKWWGRKGGRDHIVVMTQARADDLR